MGKSGDSSRRPRGDKGKHRAEEKSSTPERSRWRLISESRSEKKQLTTRGSEGSGSRLGMRGVAEALPPVAEEQPRYSGGSPDHRPYELHNPDSEDDDNDYHNYYPLPNHRLNDPNSPFFMNEATLGTISISEKMVASEERWTEYGQPGGFDALNGLYHKIEDTGGGYTWNPADPTDAANEGAMLVQYEHDRRKKSAAKESSTQASSSRTYTSGTYNEARTRPEPTENTKSRLRGLMSGSRSKTKKSTTERSKGSGRRNEVVRQSSDSGESPNYRSYDYYNLDSE